MYYGGYYGYRRRCFPVVCCCRPFRGYGYGYGGGFGFGYGYRGFATGIGLGLLLGFI